MGSKSTASSVTGDNAFAKINTINSDLSELNDKLNSLLAKAITTDNIAQQRVSYATSAGSATTASEISNTYVRTSSGNQPQWIISPKGSGHSFVIVLNEGRSYWT